MKIQLSSTLPFTPLLLDSRQAEGRRAAGQLFGVENGREYRNAVYQFRHDDQDRISYLVDPQERVYLEDPAANEAVMQPESVSSSASGELQWIDHEEGLTYKPYAFLVMNAMSQLVGQWDGIVYQAPSGERLRDAVWNSTLQVVDACFCNRLGLWVKVNLAGERTANDPQVSGATALGWVPLNAAAR